MRARITTRVAAIALGALLLAGCNATDEVAMTTQTTPTGVSTSIATSTRPPAAPAPTPPSTAASTATSSSTEPPPASSAPTTPGRRPTAAAGLVAPRKATTTARPPAKRQAPSTTTRPPAPRTSSAACTIKGNISSSGEKIYHVPGQRYYNVTKIELSKGERWFCSESDAVAAGWRKAKV